MTDRRDDLIVELLHGDHGPPEREALLAEARALGLEDELAWATRADRLLRMAGPPPALPPGLTERVLAIADQPVEAPVEESVEVPLDEHLTEPAAAPPRLKPSRSRPRFWQNVQLWRGLTVGFAAAAVALGVVAVSDDSGDEPSVDGARSLALTPGDGSPARGDAVLASAKNGTRTVRIRVEGLPPTDNGFYELWLARSPDTRVSLAVLRPDANGAIDVTLQVPDLGDAWNALWLTREADDGDPHWSDQVMGRAKFA